MSGLAMFDAIFFKLGVLMFGRDLKVESRVETARTNAPAALPSHMSLPSVALTQGRSKQAFEGGPGDRPTSILGPDISIYGQQLVLKTKGSLLIQGQIQGDVHGESVTVDNGANVTGVITARTIVIEGDVSGSLKGSTVILHASSKVDANIVHQILSIAEGAQFEGSVQRAKDISEVTPDLS
jgi:cytoskeletal protein CcmA (bactofilin family)